MANWRQILVVAGIIYLSGGLLGCAEKELDPNDPTKSFGIARESYDDENWEIALGRLGEFKARFPYSKYATEAELLIANTYFEMERFAEAATAYEQFIKLHPNHEKVDYAMFRVGESYWADAPEEIDREQDYTLKAIVEWEKLIARLPDSPFAKKAQELVKVGKRRIAESIEFIGKFYCKMEKYHACAYRSMELADEYPEFTDLRIEALERAIVALREVADGKAKDTESDKNLYHKRMTAEEIRQRADNLERTLTDFKRSIGKSH